MSDYEGATESEGEEENQYVLQPNYTILLVDVTTSMCKDNILKKCLQDIYELLKLIDNNNRHTKKSKCGVILLGTGNPPCFLVLPENRNLDSLQSIIEKGLETSIHELPLRDGLQLAIDEITDKSGKYDNKSIVLLTNNSEPNIENHDKVFEVARTFRALNIEFVLLPCGGASLEDCKFYQNLFMQFEQSKCEMIRNEPNITTPLKKLIFVAPRTTKIVLFYQEYKSFELESQKLFKSKYASYKRSVENEQTKTLSHVKLTEKFVTTSYEDYIGDDSKNKYESDSTFISKLDTQKFFMVPSNSGGKKVVFTQRQIKDLENVPNTSSLQLLWVSDNITTLQTEEIAARYLTCAIGARNEAFFKHFWNFCVEKNKVLYCVLQTKKMMPVILKPASFKNEKCFIMYSIGYSNNYNDIKYKVNEYINIDRSEITEIQKAIVQEFYTNRTCIDIRDPKLTYEQQLTDSKVTGDRFDPALLIDETSIEYHDVDAKVADLTETLQQHLELIAPVEMKKQKKAATGRPAKRAK